MNVGEKIKALRQQNGLSQEGLANKLGVSRQAITKWETNRGVPDIENLKCLSKKAWVFWLPSKKNQMIW